MIVWFRLILWVLLFVSFSVYGQKKYTISGYIRDFETGENLIGANIFENTSFVGNASNKFGFYSLSLPEGNYHIFFSYVGYKTRDTLISFTQNKEYTIQLSPEKILQEVIVSAELERINTPQMSSISIPIEQFKSLPKLAGEVDIFKVLQLMPGIKSGGEGSSGLYVRGGGPDQNLILLDGVPVYNASHLFGFFSVFNSDAINNVEIIKGGFPARYGGRLSSVIDITMKEGNLKKFTGSASIGLISSKITLEAPIIKNKTSFIISGRRTYIDLLAKPIISALSPNGSFGYYFYDINAKINHIFSDKDRLYLSFYTGTDKFYSLNNITANVNVNVNGTQYPISYEYKADNQLYWGNITGVLRWNHVITPKVFNNFTLTYSQYAYNFSNENTATPTGNLASVVATQNAKTGYNSGIDDWAIKTDFEWTLNTHHSIRSGVGIIYHTFNPGVLSRNTSLGIDTTYGEKPIHAFEMSLYAEDDYKITDRWFTNVGLHASGFLVNGAFYKSIQPRISVRYLFNKELAIKASYSTMAQFIHLLSNSGIGLPTDLWVPATPNVKPQESQQVALGIVKGWRKKYEITIETYYKTMNNLLQYKAGASYLALNEDWQNKIEIGNGVSYGLEILIQKKIGKKLTGWIGYTLSRTERTFANINNGQTFPYKYDRRHDISIVGIYKIKEGIEISATWVYATGNSITLPSERYQQVGQGISQQGNRNFTGGIATFEDITYFDAINSYKMNAYHRLDVNISFTKKIKWGERTWSFGAYNLYNRKNPFFISIGLDANANKNFLQYSLFPIIPSILYTFTFK